MKRGNPLLERIRLERHWQKTNRWLKDLRHGRRCTTAIQCREVPLLDALDSGESGNSRTSVYCKMAQVWARFAKVATPQ